MIKNIFKQDWLYLLLFAVLLGLTVLKALSFRYGFFTAYDEAYFLLKLQEAYDMSCITGKSQWNLLAVHWFPYLDLTNKISSSIASSILMWATILMATITSCIIFDKKRALKYLSIITLIFFPSIGGDLCYVPMQTAVLAWSLCALALFYHYQKTWQKSLCAIICGLCLGLACFIIIPAALILLICVALLIVIWHWRDIKRMVIFLLSGVVGGLLSIAYVQFIVCDIAQIVDAMLFTATYIGKSGYHYDSTSFLFQFGLFFRDCIFVLVVFTGAYRLAQLCHRKWVGGVVYIGILLLYMHYQQKPIVAPSMFLASTFIIPFIFSKHNYRWKNAILNARAWYYIFLLLFPLLASLGTNTALSDRISCFLLAWLFLWFDWDKQHPTDNWKYVRLGVIILFIIPLWGVVQKYQTLDDSHHFTRGNRYFAEIAITEKQEDYFNRVYDILEEYNYQPKQSAILTACYDYCCLYAFDAVNAANYHQVQNFHYFPKANMIEPDFIFLCKWDSIVMAKELTEMPWGWPDEFDEYFVGSPEPDDAPWVNHVDLEQRKLYCRKSLRKQDQ